MAFSRYQRTDVLGYNLQYGSSNTHAVIRSAVKNNRVPFKTIVLHEAERLDHIAFRHYRNGRYWWVIAAASDIGWGLQVPPGTIINIPDIVEIAKLVG
jgi:hypothetical protein